MRSLAVLFCLAAYAQQTAAPRLEFEVVSIKPGDPTNSSSSGRGTPGGLEWRNTTANNLIRGAYNLNEFQLVGSPKWASTERFNVDAKYPAGADRHQASLMIQSMLADRFHLQFHRETKMLPEYNLVVAKGGPKLERADPSDPKKGSSSQGPRLIRARGQNMASLARMLISVVDAPVVDRTGIEGEYNFDLQFVPLLAAPNADDPLGDIFAVLQQKLGLKLEATKGPVEVLVVDHLEMPTAN